MCCLVRAFAHLRAGDRWAWNCSGMLISRLNLFLRPWRWRRYVPPKRRLKLNVLQDVISQKMIPVSLSVLCISPHSVQPFCLSFSSSLFLYVFLHLLPLHFHMFHFFQIIPSTFVFLPVSSYSSQGLSPYEVPQWFVTYRYETENPIQPYYRTVMPSEPQLHILLSVHHLTTFHGPILHGPSVPPTLNVPTLSILVLPIIGNCRVQSWMASNGIISIRSRKIRLLPRT
jgi:hypothetical protein